MILLKLEILIPKFFSSIRTQNSQNMSEYNQNSSRIWTPKTDYGTCCRFWPNNQFYDLTRLWSGALPPPTCMSASHTCPTALGWVRWRVLVREPVSQQYAQCACSQMHSRAALGFARLRASNQPAQPPSGSGAQSQSYRGPIPWAWFRAIFPTMTLTIILYMQNPSEANPIHKENNSPLFQNSSLMSFSSQWSSHREISLKFPPCAW